MLRGFPWGQGRERKTIAPCHHLKEVGHSQMPFHQSEARIIYVLDQRYSRAMVEKIKKRPLLFPFPNFFSSRLNYFSV
jgi:hypothetical protein